MQEFIPITEVHGAYIRLNRLFSYSWASVFAVVGAQGYGKTFASKRCCIKHFMHDNQQFVILRNTDDECQRLCKDNGDKIFEDICHAYKKFEYSTNAGTMFINGKKCGEVIPISTYYKNKGEASFDNVGWVLFDEFIKEGQQRYNGDRAKQFAKLVEVTTRDRKARLILTANALDPGDPVLELLGITIKSGQFGYYLNHEKGVVLYYAPNSQEFETRRKNSISWKLIKGTYLDDSMAQNKFEGADFQRFDKRPPVDLIGIYYNNEGNCFRLYREKHGNKCFASRDLNPKSCAYMRYVFNSSQAGKDRVLRGTPTKKWLKDLLASKKVYFESSFIFNVYCSIIE